MTRKSVASGRRNFSMSRMAATASSGDSERACVPPRLVNQAHGVGVPVGIQLAHDEREVLLGQRIVLHARPRPAEYLLGLLLETSPLAVALEAQLEVRDEGLGAQ